MATFDSELASGGISIRPLRAEDLRTTLAWRNHDDSRVWFKTNAPLVWESHLGWFEKYRHKPNDYMFIAESDGKPVAQLSLYDVTGDRGEVGRFLTDPPQRGKGFMARALPLLFQFARSKGLTLLYLDVKEENERAIRLYEHVGFHVTDNKDGLVLMEIML